MKTLLIVLLLAAPAAAQSFYPSLTGARYCSLRAMGIEQREALRTAMLENWDQTRVSPTVKIDGELFTVDQVEVGKIMAKCGG